MFVAIKICDSGINLLDFMRFALVNQVKQKKKVEANPLLRLIYVSVQVHVVYNSLQAINH